MGQESQIPTINISKIARIQGIDSSLKPYSLEIITELSALKSKGINTIAGIPVELILKMRSILADYWISLQVYFPEIRECSSTILNTPVTAIEKAAMALTFLQEAPTPILIERLIKFLEEA